MIEIQIEMGRQIHYQEATKKYGKNFADSVVAQELQLYADNLNCFDEYSTYDWMQDEIVKKSGADNSPPES